MMDHKLIDEYPILLLPTLVKVFGFERSAILQQVHFLTQQPKSGKALDDGEKWVWNTYAEWQEGSFPFWKEDTVRKNFNKLEQEGLLLSCQPNKASWDRTKFYRVDARAVAEAIERYEEDTSACHAEDSTTRHARTTSSGDADARSYKEAETSSETSSETSLSCPPSPDVASVEVETPPPTKSTAAPKAVVVEIFEFWKETFGKNANTRLGDLRRRKIEARLRDGYTADQIKNAILGCSWSGHNNGENESGAAYNDLELICRNEVKLDRFLSIYEARQNGGSPPKNTVAPFRTRQKPDEDEFVQADHCPFELRMDLIEGTPLYGDRDAYEEFKRQWRIDYPRYVQEIEEYERGYKFRSRFSQASQIGS